MKYFDGEDAPFDWGGFGRFDGEMRQTAIWMGHVSYGHPEPVS